MFDPLMISLSLLHASVLLFFIGFTCRGLAVPMKEWPLFILLLLWGGMVFAGHGASSLDGLGKLEIYVPATALGVALMLFFFNTSWKEKAREPLFPKPSLAFAPIPNLKIRKYLFWFLAITLGLYAAASIAIGMSVYPDNADSMIYRLPRTIWYVSSGNFLHPFDSPDNRLVYYPLDGVMLYIPYVLYGLPGTFHAIPSLISWFLIVYTAYRFARELGADRLIALFSAWLVGLTPSILAQATSTNDEILAATALLTSLFMGWRWLVTGRPGYFLMAGLALSLSAGTKLHIVFLLPIIAIGAFILAWNIWKNHSLLSKLRASVSTKTLILTALLMVVMFAPFLFYNYASVGRFYFLSDFKDDVFNLSASLRVGLQNMLIYLSQMILSPIGDINFWPVANDRQHFNTWLNNIFNPLIAPWLSNDPSHYHLGYRFVGITIPVSVRFVEFSLWAGFIWLLWPLQARLATKVSGPLKPVLLLVAMTPPLWLLFWCFSTLYMEGTATYFSFYLICAAPAAALTFLRIESTIKNEIRWVVVTLVTLSSLIICHNLLMYSGFRALPDLYYSRTWPYDWLLSERPIIDEIRRAQRIRIVQTHEKMPYFGYMHWNPLATYHTPFPIKSERPLDKPEEILQVYPISGLSMYGFMPIKVPGKKTIGMTYLGAVRAIGREAIFAMGNDVHKRYPTESDYIIQQARIAPAPNASGSWTVTLDAMPWGYSPDDHLLFAYEVRQADRVVFTQPPTKLPGLVMNFPFNPDGQSLTVTLIVSSAWNNKELARATYALGSKSSWLPEGPEY